MDPLHFAARSGLVELRCGSATFLSVSDSAIDFGCDYCRDDQNRFYGHVTQIGSDEGRRMLLLRCPRCGALYENSARGPDLTRRLTETEAERLFPGFKPPAQ